LNLCLDKGNIYERISSWKVFESATFKLRPTNPDSDDDFKKLDEIIIKAGGNAKLSFNIKDSESKSLAKKDSIIQQGIAMASAGYGTFTLTGVKDEGRDKIISGERKKLRKKFTASEPVDLPQQIKDSITKLKEGDTPNERKG